MGVQNFRIKFRQAHNASARKNPSRELNSLSFFRRASAAQRCRTSPSGKRSVSESTPIKKVKSGSCSAASLCSRPLSRRAPSTIPQHPESTLRATSRPHFELGKPQLNWSWGWSFRYPLLLDGQPTRALQRFTASLIAAFASSQSCFISNSGSLSSSASSK